VTLTLASFFLRGHKVTTYKIKIRINNDFVVSDRQELTWLRLRWTSWCNILSKELSWFWKVPLRFPRHRQTEGLLEWHVDINCVGKFVKRFGVWIVKNLDELRSTLWKPILSPRHLNMSLKTSWLKKNKCFSIILACFPDIYDCLVFGRPGWTVVISWWLIK